MHGAFLMQSLTSAHPLGTSEQAFGSNTYGKLQQDSITIPVEDYICVVQWHFFPHKVINCVFSNSRSDCGGLMQAHSCDIQLKWEVWMMELIHMNGGYFAFTPEAQTPYFWLPFIHPIRKTGEISTKSMCMIMWKYIWPQHSHLSSQRSAGSQ